MLVTFRKHGYSTDYLFDFSIATDIKNSTWRTIYFDQGLLGMSREYLIKGLADEDVRHYYNYMQKVRWRAWHVYDILSNWREMMPWKMTWDSSKSF